MGAINTENLSLVQWTKNLYVEMLISKTSLRLLGHEGRAFTDGIGSLIKNYT